MGLVLDGLRPHGGFFWCRRLLAKRLARRIEGLFDRFARVEANGLAGGDFDRLATLRVPPLACRP